ncbi:MAG: lysyl oxidase family protein [Myxococcota bacterium]|nr:lysyl oxidase family protein [Myxococcota bacterium]
MSGPLLHGCIFGRGRLVLLLPSFLMLSGCIAGGHIEGGEDCATYYPDLDGDGLGDPRLPVTLCEEQEGYVLDGSDAEPDCPSNDSDDCGVCAGGNADKDCAGVCFGAAALDGCGTCTGGTTGVEPVPGDDFDGDGIADLCDACLGEEGPRMIVEYASVPHFSGAGGPYTAQVSLYANGDILFQYGDTSPYEASANGGLQSPDGLLGVDLGLDAAFLSAPRSELFRWSEAEGNYRVESNLTFPYNELSAVGLSLNLGDDDSVTHAQPFPFSFYGEIFEGLQVSSNGFLFLGDEVLPGYSNQVFPTEIPGGMIAPFWDDLNPGVSGVIRSHYAADCAVDCAGVAGGLARPDQCEVCSGGTTGLLPDSDLDCAGVCWGEALIDACGICSGGTTGLPPSDPSSCPQLPDFVPDPDYLADTLYIDYVDVGEDSCLLAEGCVDGLGLRKVLRFGSRVGNIGATDFHLGVPPGPGFHWDACHGHYHFDDYADYRLIDVVTGDEAAIGHKNGWCLMDSGVFDAEIAAEAGNACNTYNCGNQGIGRGCHDTYGASLACQWVDVTDLPDGTYQVQVTVNPDGDLEELDSTNNRATATVDLTGDTVTYQGP